MNTADTEAKPLKVLVAPRLWHAWNSLVYLVATIVLNLLVPALWPKFIRTWDVALECSALWLLPILWGAYLWFRCPRQKGAVAWSVRYLALLCSIVWLCIGLWALVSWVTNR
ncbi:MAG: hypothetical protein C5B50_15805 [Verrucomicrobia bacterium]|nr:MAG: hypothetical protein C5B50_15805 [Verrucomicrobiota bacterium]